MAKPAFRPIAPLDNVDDAALAALSDSLGVPTMVRPEPKPAARKAPAEPPPRPEKLTVELPRYLFDAIKQEAIRQRTSIRHLVMQAFKAQGLHVAPEDLIPDARRSKQKYRHA